MKELNLGFSYVEKKAFGHRCKNMPFVNLWQGRFKTENCYTGKEPFILAIQIFQHCSDISFFRFPAHPRRPGPFLHALPRHPQPRGHRRPPQVVPPAGPAAGRPHQAPAVPGDAHRRAIQAKLQNQPGTHQVIGILRGKKIWASVITNYRTSPNK